MSFTISKAVVIDTLCAVVIVSGVALFVSNGIDAMKSSDARAEYVECVKQNASLLKTLESDTLTESHVLRSRVEVTKARISMCTESLESLDVRTGHDTAKGAR